MTARDYIEEKLTLLAKKFIDIQIRYEYRANTRSHLIEIIPLSFFEEDEAYFKEESAIEDEFEQLFPSENIVFISEGSLTVIKKADMELGYQKSTFIINLDQLNISAYIEVLGFSEDIQSQDFNYALAA